MHKNQNYTFLSVNSFIYELGFLQGRSVNNTHYLINKYLHKNQDLSNKTMFRYFFK